MTKFPLLAIILLLFTLLWASPAPLKAQEPSPVNHAGNPAFEPPDEPPNPPPFILPFASPPGPDTWLLGQPYGNTVGAYFQRDIFYQAGQGLHFGLDFSAPCDTEIIAIGDGLVAEIDKHGSPPHSLMIDHPNGYSSFYGHLRQAPDLQPGQPVKQGQVIALSGDSFGTCRSAPHLHLEIRNNTHNKAYNPVPLIQADWDSLALIGSFNRGFERDLTNPHRWQIIKDQPLVLFGGALLNEYTQPWPPAAGGRNPSASPAVSPAVSVVSSSPATPQPATPTLPQPVEAPELRQLTRNGCCVQPAFSPDNRQVLFIDQPEAGAPSGIYGVTLADPRPTPTLVDEVIGFRSDDRTIVAVPRGDLTYFTNETTGQSWTIDTNGNWPRISPDNQRVLWVATDTEGPYDQRQSDIWLADLDGANPRLLFSTYGGGFTGWFPDSQRLLFTGRNYPGDEQQILFMYDLETNRRTDLFSHKRLRGGELSPGGSWVSVFITFADDPQDNGLWLIRTDGSEQRRLELPHFGAYRWRDDETLLFIPMRAPAETSMQFWTIDAATGQWQPLTDPAALPFSLSNGDWDVSPDGRSVVFVNSADQNLWLISLP
jgi:Tol biopolymer transport system component